MCHIGKGGAEGTLAGVAILEGEGENLGGVILVEQGDSCPEVAVSMAAEAVAGAMTVTPTAVEDEDSVNLWSVLQESPRASA